MTSRREPSRKRNSLTEAQPASRIAELQALSYDQYRDIRFRPDHALWRAENLPFELMFFHLGKFQTESVGINEVTSARRAAHSLQERRLRLWQEQALSPNLGRHRLRRFSCSLLAERQQIQG